MGHKLDKSRYHWIKTSHYAKTVRLSWVSEGEKSVSHVSRVFVRISYRGVGYMSQNVLWKFACNGNFVQSADQLKQKGQHRRKYGASSSYSQAGVSRYH
jgi:hypothetical protein